MLEILNVFTFHSTDVFAVFTTLSHSHSWQAHCDLGTTVCIRGGSATTKASGFVLFGQVTSTAIPWLSPRF